LTDLVLCYTEHVWHPAERVAPPKEAVVVLVGTHGGRLGERPTKHLSDELRANRRAKNARNLGRAGDDTRRPGSQKRVTKRLHLRGNRAARGLGR
jgi:hypothetical protein